MMITPRKVLDDLRGDIDPPSNLLEKIGVLIVGVGLGMSCRELYLDFYFISQEKLLEPGP